MRHNKAKYIAKDVADFSSDGCSMSPDLTFHSCCEEHDYYYRNHSGPNGLPITRAEADRRLRECIARKGVLGWEWKVLPWVYWAGVRLLGRRAWKGG